MKREGKGRKKVQRKICRIESMVPIHMYGEEERSRWECRNYVRLGDD